MRDVVGDLVERGVPVDLVAGRREERVLLVRARRGDVGGRRRPRCSRPRCAGCRDRARGAAPSPGRRRAASRRARGSAPACRAGRPRTAASRTAATAQHVRGLRCRSSQPVTSASAWRRARRRPREPMRRRRARPCGCATRCALQGPSPSTTALNSRPVDRAEVVVAALVVPAQLGVGQGDAELLGLRHGHVDEALPQLVVGVPLDAPRHRLRGVGRARRRAGRTSSVTATRTGSSRPAPWPAAPRCRASSSAAARSPAADGRTPPCRCGSSPGRTGRRSCGTAAPGCRSRRRRPASRSRRRRRSSASGS